MNFRKMRPLITVALVLIFTLSLGLSAFAEGTTETSISDTATAASTVTTSTSTTDSTAATTVNSSDSQTASTGTTTDTVTTPASPTEPAASTTTPSVMQKGKAKVQNIRQQLNQLRKAQQQVQVQAKKQQKLMSAVQFKQLLNQEVDRPIKVAQKKNVAGARIGVVKKIETADNGKIKILVQRGDHSKVFNQYFTFNIDPAKILVYDRPTKTQKTLSDVKAGDVVRIIPVRGASLFLIDIIAHPAAAPVPVPVP
ncbi:MAG: hypothetical protein ACM3NT_03010, partial [Methylocystaceae bacterium]